MVITLAMIFTFPILNTLGKSQTQERLGMNLTNTIYLNASTGLQGQITVVMIHAM